MPVETVLLFILGVVIFIVGLVLSVALHELGHLTFAKLFGVKVSQYMVGFGRTLWSIKRGGTEYGIKPILLGGYISMAGMFPPNPNRPISDKPQSALFSALVQDAREVSANTIGADDTHAFYRAKPWKRVIIMLAGPFMNLVIGVVIAAILVTSVGAPTASIASVASCVPASASATTTTKCTSSDAASPALTAGLKAGDVVVSIGSVSSPSPQLFQSILQHSAGKSVDLVVKRAGKLVAITLTPVSVSRDALDSNGTPESDTSGKPIVEKLGAIGVGLGQTFVKQPITATFDTVGIEINGIFSVLGRFPAGLVGVWNAVFNGDPRSANSPVSVVGVGRAIGTIASAQDAPVTTRVYGILSLLGSLNISLFVFNLIPLLPLDGGHVIGAIWESLRRRFARLLRRRDPGPVDLARFLPLTIVVVGVLGVISALLIVADLVNPVAIG